MKGILFKPDMIQAIIEGRKTQTRRLGGLKEINKTPNIWECTTTLNEQIICFYNLPTLISTRIKPRHQVSETVYVKEAWATDKIFDAMTPRQIEETGLGTVGFWYKHNDTQLGREGQTKGRWRSPLFMPEWAARYFITITDVRAERLQEITEEDAEAEGISWSPCGAGENPEIISAIENYAILWDSINKDYLWESNPWVFVYTFKQEMIRRR